MNKNFIINFIINFLALNNNNLYEIRLLRILYMSYMTDYLWSLNLQAEYENVAKCYEIKLDKVYLYEYKKKLDEMFIKVCLVYFKILSTLYNLLQEYNKYNKYNLLQEYNKYNYKKKYIEKGYKYNKYNNLGIYLKNFKDYNNDLYFQNLKNLYKSYCYLLIRLNRKNLFLTLLNNEGNVLCKTNVGASGFKKKVKRTGYAIKGTGKNFIKKIKRSLVKSIFILYKKKLKNKENNNNKVFQKKIQNLKIIKKNIQIFKKKRLKIKKNKNKNKTGIKKIKINFFKKNLKKTIRSNLLWIKIYKNLKKYRIYYNLTLKNLIKKNLRIIFRVKTSLKLWAFRFIVYGLFKKLPWFRGIEFRLPIPHSNGLRLRKKRRI